MFAGRWSKEVELRTGVVPHIAVGLTTPPEFGHRSDVPPQSIRYIIPLQQASVEITHLSSRESIVETKGKNTNDTMAPIAINSLASNGNSEHSTFPAGYAAPRELPAYLTTALS